MKNPEPENEMRRRHRELQEKADADYKRISEQQKEWAYRIAADIVEGKPIPMMERKMAAGALRLWADGLDGIRKKKQGKPAEFDHAALAWEYQRLRRHVGLTDATAKSRLAEEYECSDEMVRRILRDYTDGIEAVLDGATVIWADRPTKGK